MELFAYVTDPANPTTLVDAKFIDGYKSALWVERYREPGEIKIVDHYHSKLRQTLPEGTIMSHKDTHELMIIENHEIDGGDLIITGRSFESIFEQRIVGMNVNWAAPPTGLPEYVVPAAPTWTQAVNLINAHITPTGTVDDDDSYDNVSAVSIVSGTGEEEERVFPRQYLNIVLDEILYVDDLGIKTVRRSQNPPSGGSTTETRIVIHTGVDRSDSVIFSRNNGDVVDAQYLWSNKTRKTAALIVSTYVETVVKLAGTKYNRRMLLVDASDLDGHLSAAPTAGALTTLKTRMQRRGKDALAAMQGVRINSVDLSNTISNYKYRTDYEVGDYVTVEGDYDASSVMRVVEYAEIQDENGSSGHPVLEPIFA